MKLLRTSLAALTAVVSLASAIAIEGKVLTPRAATNPSRYVFAHLIVGTTSNRQGTSDWDADMVRAKAYGIDAFALNIGTDSFTDTQLGYAYTSAANNGMKVFLSFDFNFWSTGSAADVGRKIAQYAGQSAQLMVDGKVFVSSFVGDGVDVGAVRSNAGVAIYFAPNFHPSYGTDMSTVDGALNWMGWPNNGNNRAPDSTTVTVAQGDSTYINALGSKGYIAPVSPWFFTHFGAEVSYSKNWLFPSELLWYQRWNQLLSLGPRFVEIISWNDYGESHYVGPLSSKHTDDGASKWCNDMPHNGWLDMAKPFIAAYKAGATSASNYIQTDQLFYWYRPQLMNTNCDATDTCMAPANNASGQYYIGRPNGWQTVSDTVFVVSLLATPGTITVTSGNNKQVFSASAGASSFTVPMGVGKQTFSLTRSGNTVMSGTSPKDIISGCVCGLYNFNAFVGSLPAGMNDALDAAGLAAFNNGLRVSTCSATPSLSSIASTTSASVTVTTSSTTTNLASTPSSTGKNNPISSTSSNPLSPSTTKASTTISTLSTTASSSLTASTSATCNSGSGQNNYAGLCSFCCSYGYCPPGPCTCNSYGTPATPPPETGVHGVPANGLDSSYSGLCSYACDHGYCPSGACQVVS